MPTRDCFPARVPLLLVLAFIPFLLQTSTAARELSGLQRTRVTRLTQALTLPRSGSVHLLAAQPPAKRTAVSSGTGAIGGTVRGLDAEGLASARVIVRPADVSHVADTSYECGGDVPGRASTAVARGPVRTDGSYLFEGLAPGTYYISATARDCETRYYRQARSLTTAARVEVGADSTVMGIDFTLAPLHTVGGSITGTVTDRTDGRPIPGYECGVHAYSTHSPPLTVSDATDEDGVYVMRGLPSGTYVVSVFAGGYLPRFYADATQLSQARLVEVTAPEQTEAIDFSLTRSGCIAGFVRDRAGNPVAGARVAASAEDAPDSEFWTPGAWERADESGQDLPPVSELVTGAVSSEPRNTWTRTEADGAYVLTGLALGSFRVQAWTGVRQFYAVAWYAGAESWKQATPVMVASGRKTAGIDLVLVPPVMASAISGCVTNTQGHPVARAVVTIQEAMEGNPEAPDSLANWISFTDSVCCAGPSRPSGESPQQLPPVLPDGSLLALPSTRTLPPAPPAGDVPGLLPRTEDSMFYPSLPGLRGCLPGMARTHAITDEDGVFAMDGLPAGTYILSLVGEASAVYMSSWYANAVYPVRAAKVVLGEHEQLQRVHLILPSVTMTLSGTVRDQHGNALAGACVQVTPREDETWLTPARTWTDSTGAYRVDGLLTGTYTVQATYSTRDKYGRSWYSGALDPSGATPVRLAHGTDRADIDMELAVRLLYGAVAGRITDAAGGQPVARACVKLPLVWRRILPGGPQGYFARTAITDGSGGFRMERIPEGVYSLTVYANGVYAEGGIDADLPTSVGQFRVTGGETAIVNVSVTQRNDGEGVISGTVRTTAAGGGESAQSGGSPGLEAAAVPAEAAPVDAGDARAVASDSGAQDAAHAPEIAVVVAFPDSATVPPVRYSAITERDGTYTLRGLAAGDYILMCFAPGRIGMYYGGVYAPDRAQRVQVDDARPVEGIDFELMPGCCHGGLVEEGVHSPDEGLPTPASNDTLDMESPAAAVGGTVTDLGGWPVANVAVYLLNAAETPVGFAQTDRDGAFQFVGVPPGRYRVYAGMPGYLGRYNGNQPDFGAATPLDVGEGRLGVTLMLPAELAPEPSPAAPDSDLTTAVTKIETALPLTMVLRRNYPNPFNPETRIAFTVPASVRTTLRVRDALGRLVAVLFDQKATAGYPYEVRFRPDGAATGVYFYTLEAGGQRLTRAMALVK